MEIYEEGNISEVELLQNLTSNDSKFNNKIMYKGAEYYNSNKVDAILKEEDKIKAYVFGSENNIYKVEIQVDDNDNVIKAFCNCSFYQKNHENCKHIYATLLKKQYEGKLINLKEYFEVIKNKEDNDEKEERKNSIKTSLENAFFESFENNKYNIENVYICLGLKDTKDKVMKVVMEDLEEDGIKSLTDYKNYIDEIYFECLDEQYKIFKKNGKITMPNEYKNATLGEYFMKETEKAMQRSQAKALREQKKERARNRRYAFWAILDELLK